MGVWQQERWEERLVSVEVLVLSVITLLVAAVEGSGLISVLSVCFLAMSCSRTSEFACADGLCLLLGPLWAVLH